MTKISYCATMLLFNSGSSDSEVYKRENRSSKKKNDPASGKKMYKGVNIHQGVPVT